MNNKMNKKRINIIPRYNPGDVIMLSHRLQLPTRIYITNVYRRAIDTEWMYDVMTESEYSQERKVIPMKESYITDAMSKSSANVYNTQFVKKMLDNGFRYCGNYKKRDALVFCNSIKDMGNIKNIELHPALDGSGIKVDRMYGVWIRYNYVINDSGQICYSVQENDNEVIVVK